MSSQELHVYFHFGAPANGGGQAEVISQIKNTEELVMGAIDTLRSAVSAVELNTTQGFDALRSSLEELAADIAALPNNTSDADIEAEAARLSGVASTIAEATGTFATAIRDALPTATIVNPEPVPEAAPEATPSGEATEGASSAPASSTDADAADAAADADDQPAPADGDFNSEVSGDTGVEAGVDAGSEKEVRDNSDTFDPDAV